MQIEFTAAPGTSLQAKSLPNGQMIKGIQIDNPSGNWLYVVSEQQYCPPYTIGWAIPTTYDQSSITIEARLAGPASQAGTNQGDSWRLTLFSEAVSPAAGTPYQFIDQFTGNQTSVSGTISVTGTNSPVTMLTLPALPTKRYRIKTIMITKNNDVLGLFDVNLGANTFFFELRPPQTYAYFYYPDGLDLPINTAFSIVAVMSSFAGFSANAAVTFQTL